MPFFNYSLLFEINFPFFFGQLGMVGNFFQSQSETEKLAGSDKFFFELFQKEKFLELKEKKRYTEDKMKTELHNILM